MNDRITDMSLPGVSIRSSLSCRDGGLTRKTAVGTAIFWAIDTVLTVLRWFFAVFHHLLWVSMICASFFYDESHARNVRKPPLSRKHVEMAWYEIFGFWTSFGSPKAPKICQVGTPSWLRPSCAARWIFLCWQVDWAAREEHLFAIFLWKLGDELQNPPIYENFIACWLTNGF